MLQRVIAIVVTWNARQWVDRCLGSLLESSAEPDIIVIDNASTDGTASYIKEHFGGKVELVTLTDNIGFGQANNIGLRKMLKGDYDFAYLLNQDAWVERETIERIVSVWDEDFGIVSPVQINANGNPDRNFSKKCGLYLKSAKVDDSPVEVNFVMAAHWLMSRKAVARTGGFSPAFPHYGEDDNYIDRLHHHGMKVGVMPGVTAVHDRGGRKESRERRMRSKCLSVVVRFSNPGHFLPLHIFLEPLRLLGMSMKNLSVIPMKYIPVLIKRYPELIRLRRCSKGEGAFLSE